ncbi:Protein kinase-like domain [Pseudocohnilembus persalinus]|uniref:Protein kinase-like domain n=1 Tax=Pseudocohnilembus persalinus TaxID=266149 RepID=A0A0V0QS34_PSEPJ|nr:Protein kinase-like domain [Pseudocohnilembus persalinus]|eukprot:KRX05119.1 Protein kinase-like domain [Pseudocohnilembus persalinus]
MLLQFEEGLPLHKILQMHGKITYKFSKVILYQVVKIIKQIHKAGFIYRDLKASNLIVQKNGGIALIDFGYAKKIEKSRTKSFCGTTHAMAPEFFNQEIMAENGQGYDYSVDFYAIGILAFEILTGKPPFGYNCSEQDITNGINEDIVQCIEQEEARDFIYKLLKKDTSKRLGYKNGCDEILDHIYFDDIDKDVMEKIMETKQLLDIDEQFSIDFQFYEEDVDAFSLQKNVKDNEDDNRNLNELQLDENQKSQMDKLSSMFG